MAASQVSEQYRPKNKKANNLKCLQEHRPALGYRIIILKESKSLPELGSCNIQCFTWEAGSSEVGSEKLSDLFCACWVIPAGMEVSTLLYTATKNPLPLALWLILPRTQLLWMVRQFELLFWLNYRFLSLFMGSTREQTDFYLYVHIYVSAKSCFFGRSCHTGHRHTCCCRSSSSFSGGLNQSRSAPPKWTNPLNPACPPGEQEKWCVRRH